MQTDLKLIILFLIFTSFIFASAEGIETGNAEIVITDVFLEPEHPQAGDKVAILANVYNGGTYRTDYYAKVVTVGFLIDGELRKIVELGNVNPGASNSIQVSTGSFWIAEWEKHDVTVILDYHDTIPDQYDNTKNNIMQKTFTIEPLKQSKISLDINPAYLIPNKSSVIAISGTLVDSESQTPLINQKIMLKIGNNENSLITDKSGRFSITKAITFSDQKLLVTALFDGSFPYLKSNYTGYVFNLPSSKKTSALILKITDSTGKYDFTNLPPEVAVFQDSYDILYTKIQATKDSLLDNKTLWVGVTGNHSYLEEIYVKGRFLFSTDWAKIQDEEVRQSELYIPETAQIKFHATDSKNVPLLNATIQNWIYSAITDKDGYTQWIDMLPTPVNKEPYVAVGHTSIGQSFESEPFFVASGERKIIELSLKESQIVIPSWIRNNAKWWSEDQITTSDFAKGIQYLIQQKTIVIPKPEVTVEQGQQVPLWIKNNAKWWSEGHISDSDFVHGLQYLIKIGIIRV